MYAMKYMTCLPEGKVVSLQLNNSQCQTLNYTQKFIPSVEST
jgi:hypothetical protein